MKFNRLTLLLYFIILAMAVFSLARVALLLTQQQFFAELDVSQTLFAFVHGLRFDLSIILTLFAVPILLLAPLPGTWKTLWIKFLSWFMFLITASCSIGLLVDIIYFDYVKRHAGNEILLVGTETSFLIDSFINTYLLQFSVLGIALLGLAFLWKWGINRYEAKSGSWKKTWPVAILTFFILLLGARGSLAHKPINVINAYTNDSSKQAALSLNGVFSSLKTITRSHKVNHHHFSNDQLKKMASQYGVNDIVNLPFQKQYDNKPNKRNLVILFMESWSQRYIDGLSGSHYGVTPGIDKLLKSSLVVPTFYAAGQRSIIGLQAALVGLPQLPGLSPIGNGLEVSNYSRLGQMAKQNGYHTLFVQTSKRGSFRLDSIMQSIGFDEFYGMEDLQEPSDYPDPSGSKFGWDHAGLNKLLEGIDNNYEQQSERPILAGFFSGTTHSPFVELPNKFNKYPHDRTGKKGYLNTLSYSDWAVNQFLEKARNKPWFKDTIFIITADHVLGKDAAPTLPEMFRIPFIVYAPEIIEAGELNIIGSQLDIVPTAVDLLGFPQAFCALGDSIFRKSQDFALINQGMIIGAINADGWVSHNLKKRIDSGFFTASNPEALSDLEKQLLFYDQVTYNSLQSNSWSK